MDPKQYLKLQHQEIQPGDVVSFLDPDSGSHRTRHVLTVGNAQQHPGQGYIIVSPVVMLSADNTAFDVIGEPMIIPLCNVRRAGRARSSFERGQWHWMVVREGLRLQAEEQIRQQVQQQAQQVQQAMHAVA